MTFENDEIEVEHPRMVYLHKVSNIDASKKEIVIYIYKSPSELGDTGRVDQSWTNFGNFPISARIYPDLEPMCVEN